MVWSKRIHPKKPEDVGDLGKTRDPRGSAKMDARATSEPWLRQLERLVQGWCGFSAVAISAMYSSLISEQLK